MKQNPTINSDELKCQLIEYFSAPLVISSNMQLLPEHINHEESRVANECSLIELDQRARYLDSSIWMQFHHLTNIGTIHECDLRFASDFGLYNVENMRIIRGFNARLCENALIDNPFSERFKSFAAYLFSSEGYNKGACSLIMKKIREYVKPLTLELKILFVTSEKSYMVNEWDHKINKFAIIKELFEENTQKSGNFSDFCKVSVFPMPSTRTDKPVVDTVIKDNGCDGSNEKLQINLFIDFVESSNVVPPQQRTNSYDLVKTRIQQCRYDIIMLHYFIDEHGDLPTTKFLKEIKDFSEDTLDSLPFINYRGPLKKFWFFFASTYSTAMRETMRTENMHYSEKYWNISRGACPLATPYLFLHNFFFQLKRMIQAFMLRNYSRLSSPPEELNQVTTLIDFLYYIFGENVQKTVRKHAVDNFNAFLNLKSMYHTICKDYYGVSIHDMPKAEDDITSGSIFIQSLFPDIKYYSNQFWEHMQHLMYLTTYGNTGQWNAMWDDYMCVKYALNQANKDIQTEPKVTQLIERYITELKLHHM
ncbi:MAG: hypothetical protein SNJ29_15275 [Rikenellaceae bacterium]